MRHAIAYQGNRAGFYVNSPTPQRRACRLLSRGTGTGRQMCHAGEKTAWLGKRNAPWCAGAQYRSILFRWECVIGNISMPMLRSRLRPSQPWREWIALLCGYDRHNEFSVGLDGAVFSGAQRIFEHAGLSSPGFAMDHQHQHLAGGDVFLKDGGDIGGLACTDRGISDHEAGFHVGIGAMNDQPAVFRRGDAFGRYDTIGDRLIRRNDRRGHGMSVGQGDGGRSDKCEGGEVDRGFHGKTPFVAPPDTAGRHGSFRICRKSLNRIKKPRSLG